MREEDIIYENRDVWVGREKPGVFTVYVNGLTYAKADSSYDNESLAIARCDYLARPGSRAYANFRLPETVR